MDALLSDFHAPHDKLRDDAKQVLGKPLRMTTELRCEGTLFGIVSDDKSTIEVKCKRSKCGARPGVIILHTLSLETGKVVKTKRFKQPRQERNMT